MNGSSNHFLYQHPDPWWIYDCRSLAIIDANEAAVEVCGYDRHSLTGLSIADLSDDPPAHLDTVGSGGLWRLRANDGSVIILEVTSRDFDDTGIGGRLRFVSGRAGLGESERRSRPAVSLRLQETLDSISDAFFTLDDEWRFTFINTQAEILLSRDRSSLIGQKIWAEFPETVGSNFEILYRKVVEQRRTIKFIEFFAPLDKSLEVNAYPSPDGIAVYFRDVTRELKDQEYLRLLEAAVSRQNEILMITEAEPIDWPDGPRIVYVNEAFVRQTGYSREEVIGKTPRMLQGPKTDRRELARISRALAQWQPVRAEVINYTSDGKEFWVDMDIVPIADETGFYTHWVAVERDITDHKIADEAIRVSEERFRLVSKATQDVIWDWDFETGAIWWNDGLRKVFGYESTAAGTLPDFWFDCIHPDDKDRVVASINKALDGDDENWIEEYRFLKVDGKPVWVIDRGFVTRDGEGKPVRMIGSITDVTDRRELDAMLRQSQKLEAVGQLTGGIAHDFNNLLTVIVGNAEMLAQELSADHHLRRMAELTATAAERGAQLTGRLLAFARKQALEPAVLDLNRLVAGMDSLIRRTLSEDIDIETIRAGGLWLVEADHSQVEAALLNLAINARDAMPGGGRLTIETANTSLDDAYARMHADVVAGQYVLISVSDTGQGMSPEVIEKAFEPFFTTKEMDKGTGLGLSMVYGFMKQSGGHAKIYSEVGEGTTVKLYFPRSTSGRENSTAREADDEIPGGGESILVVEDDDLVREHLEMQLASLGYLVRSAASGPAAMAIISSDAKIDMLLTDIVMPGGMNGRQLADSARAVRPDLKVLFTSGYTRNAIVHHGRLDMGVHLLGKPYRRQELAKKVRKVLDD